MMIDLNTKELEMLDAALVAWQQQPHDRGFGSTLMMTMLRGISKKEGVEPDPEDDPKKAMEDAGIECKDRERKALMLRAKLQQAASRQSEHEIPA